MDAKDLPAILIALGFAASMVILAARMPAESAGDAFNGAVSAVGMLPNDLAIAETSSC